MYDDLSFHFTLGFSSYFVLGYVLVWCFEKDKKNNIVIGAFCFLAGVAVIFFEIMASNSKEAAGAFMQHYQVGILMQTVGMLLILKAYQRGKIINLLGRISPLTFGIYIIHPMFIEVLQKFGITSLAFNPIVSVPILSIIIFSLMGLIVSLLNETPAWMILSTRGKKIN